jgi:hypothetical protein
MENRRQAGLPGIRRPLALRCRIRVSGRPSCRSIETHGRKRMTARTWCVATVAGLALLGCAGPQPGMATSPCNEAVCRIRVWVEGGQVKVSNPRLEVPIGSPHRNPNISWELDTSDYEFRDGSIRLKGDNVAKCEANLVNPVHGTQIYLLIDRKRDRIECLYEITVYGRDDKPFRLDPLIVNN